MFRHRHFALVLSSLGLFGCSGEEPTGDPAPEPQTFEACAQEFTITAPDPSLVWTPSAIKLVSEELAPGVFAMYDDSAEKNGPAGVPLATSGGFVIGEDGVLLVESMINRQLFCQAVGLVRAQTDKPILYAVNTSSHGDHAFGNMFLPDGVKVVQHERTAAYIAEHFEEDVEFMKANFGGDSQGLGELVPVAADILVTNDEPWSVDLGGVTVEARYHGFAQTDGDLFVHVPGARVVWTGNAVIGEEPAIPWLLAGHAEESAITLAGLREKLPEGTTVVPGHGRPMSLTGLDFSIDYLQTLVSEVDSAVDQGLSQEETIESVTMEEFQGYKLWGWIHTTVNVPGTYRDLTQ